VRAIVTGGAGFIGSHVVDTLVARGDEVVVLDDLSHGKPGNVNPGAELVVADIRDQQAVEEVFGEARPEACLHLAAQADVRVSIARPDFDGEVNVLGTIRLLEAAREHGTRIAFASTGGAIYGECAEPASEEAARGHAHQGLDVLVALVDGVGPRIEEREDPVAAVGRGEGERGGGADAERRPRRQGPERRPGGEAQGQRDCGQHDPALQHPAQT